MFFSIPYKKEVFRKIFEFRFDENKYKFAKCKLCESKEKKERIIKMKDGNTTGIIRHLRNYHQDEYRKLFSVNLYYLFGLNFQLNIEH